MALLWIIIILAPIFIVVAIWTNLHKRLRCKIVITAVASLSLLVAYSLGNRQWELDKAKQAVNNVIERDGSYLDCIDKENADNIIDVCIIPMVKDLRETYDRE